METLTEMTSTIDSPILDLVAKRRSLRAFRPDPLTQDQIDRLFEAARWAPSSMNEQPWRYCYATKDQPLWQIILDTLSEGNRIWANRAPLLVVSMASNTYHRTGKTNAMAMYDLGSANAFLCLQATSMGINVHQMGGYDREAMRVSLQIPMEYDLGVVMAIGYPGDPEGLPAALRQRELASRLRNPSASFVMNESF